VDFGVAKAVGRTQTTRDGALKGKLAYMAPEQVQGLTVTRRTDIYAASIVLWEVLTGRRLFARENDAAVMLAALTSTPPAPSSLATGISETLDKIALRGLAHSADGRFRTARDMALELERSMDLALPSEVGAWVQATAWESLRERAALVAEIEIATGVPLEARSSTPPPLEGTSARTLTAASLPQPPPPATRGRLGVMLAVATLPVAIVLLAHFVRPAAPHPSVSPASAAPSGVPLPEMPAEAPPVTQEHAVPPALPALSVDSPPSAPSPPPAPPPATTPDPPHARSPAVPRVAPTQTARHPATAATCDPPYRVEESGRKIFKLECL
jgi:eukaryotic-like serine/threonine-protein kinase